jgi:hypothetical protein
MAERFDGDQIMVMRVLADCNETSDLIFARRKIMDDREKFKTATTAGDRMREAGATAKRPKAADRRIQRLRDLREDALDEPNALRANLRAATADLLEIGYRLSTGINAAMRPASNGMETCAEVMPAINSMALVHRQATRYVQLDREWESGDDTGRRGKPRHEKPKPDAGEIEI